MIFHHLDAQITQPHPRGTLNWRAIPIISRSVTWAHKPLAVFIHCAAEMCASEAYGNKFTRAIVDNCWYVHSDGTRVNRIICRVAQIELARRFGLGITQKADQSAQPKQAAQAKQEVGGKFYEISSGWS